MLAYKVMIMRCNACGKEVTSLQSHARSCIGSDPGTATYKKDRRMVEQIYYHQPAVLKNDATVESEKPVAIVFTGDWHVGNDATDHTSLRSDINLLAKLDVKIVLMGDLIDNYIPEAPRGGQHDAVLRPKDQKRLVMELVRVLDGKVIGVVGGCHEEWSYKQDDFDFADYLAEDLDRLNLNFGGVIQFIVGGTTYYVGVAHKYPGGYANELGPPKRFFSNLGPVDVVALAHVHKPFQGQFIQQGRLVHAVTCGSYKKEDRHVMRMNLTAALPAMPCVILHPGTRHVSSYLDFKDALPELERLSLVPGGLASLVDQQVEDEPATETKPKRGRGRPPKKKRRPDIQGETVGDGRGDAVSVAPVLESPAVYAWEEQSLVNLTTHVVDVGEDTAKKEHPDTEAGDDRPVGS